MHNILSHIASFMFCSAILMAAASAQTEWYTYRHDNSRTGAQPNPSDLSDPAKVRKLSVKWWYPLEGQISVGEFRASPIVVNDTVFIGSTDGYFYALDAATGDLKWLYPHQPGNPANRGDPLIGACNNFASNGSYGAWGIYSSATYAKIGGQDAVIFGASDPSLPPIDPVTNKGWGSSALFALDFSGNLIWKSQAVARVNGCSSGNTTEHHERIAYSSPMVLELRGQYKRWQPAMAVSRNRTWTHVPK